MNKYNLFYSLHQGPDPLIIPNAWNAKSAQAIEMAGFKAVATSSGAIADSLGYADGEKIPFAELLYVVQRIKATTSLPLTVDMERGYASNEEDITANIQRLIDIGVAGINLEDTEGEEVYLKKLYDIRNYLETTGQKLFLNARTDAFLQKLPLPLETTLRRAALYRDAGADGLFVTGIADAVIIKEITAATPLPVNVVAGPGLSSIEALKNCGVKRISMAVLLYKATYNRLDVIVKDIIAQNSFSPLF